MIGVIFAAIIASNAASSAVDYKPSLTAGKLASECSAQENGAPIYSVRGICAGYLQGEVETWMMLQKTREGSLLPAICLPDGLTPAELQARFMAFLAANPEKASMDASDVVMVEIIQSYHCR